MQHKYQRLLMYIAYSFLITFTLLGLFTRKYVFEGHSYYQKEKVALYLYKYQKLPENFLTKAEAQQKFNDLNSMFEAGYNIGGDEFSKEKQEGYVDWIGNYEDNLGNLYECDIYSKKNKLDNNRGLERLVYDLENNYIYYTNNHYGETSAPGFIYLNYYDLNKVSNDFFIIDLIGLVVLMTLSLSLLISKENRDNYFKDLKDVSLKTLIGIVAIILLPFYGICFIFKLITTKILDLINEHSN